MYRSHVGRWRTIDNEAMGSGANSRPYLDERGPDRKEVRFAIDSTPEGEGFEPSVPRQQIYAKTEIAADREHRGRPDS